MQLGIIRLVTINAEIFVVSQPWINGRQPYVNADAVCVLPADPKLYSSRLVE